MSSPNENDKNRPPPHPPIETGQSPSPRAENIPDELLNLVGASPPRFVSFDQLMSAADGIKNMTLAHEIAINEDFVLEEAETAASSLEKQVAETVKRAYWDAFQAKISEDPPDLSMALTMLAELKEGLFSILLPRHQTIKTQINEVLDLPLIKQQVEKGVFDFDYYGKFITDHMARHCAPIRDEKIAEIRAIKDIVPKFRLIMETLDLMRCDMANNTIKQMRPYIQQNSIEYERQKFTEYHETQKALGINALLYTEVWIKRNYEKLLQKSTRTQGTSAANANITPANIMSEAYMEVLEWPDPDNFPETLMLDQFRFMAMRDKLQTLGLITSVQLITYSVVGPAVDGVEDLKKQMKEHVDLLLQDVGKKGIKLVLDSIAVQVVKDVSDSLADRKLPALNESSKKALRGQILSLGLRENTVRALMSSRLMEFIREGMSGKHMNSIRVPKGCTAVHEELAHVLGSFLRLTSHNRSVFGDHYAHIIEKLMHRSSSELSPNVSPRVNNA